MTSVDFKLTELGKYARSTYFPSLEELQKITSPFIFQQKPEHWGLIGLDLQKSSFFYGENLNSPSYTLDENTFKFFKSALLFYFPTARFISSKLQDVQKIVLPQQRDSWSCGIQICMVNDLFSKVQKLPTEFTFFQIIQRKSQFIQNLIQHQFLYSKIC